MSRRIFQVLSVACISIIGFEVFGLKEEISDVELLGAGGKGEEVQPGDPHIDGLEQAYINYREELGARLQREEVGDFLRDVAALIVVGLSWRYPVVARFIALANIWEFNRGDVEALLAGGGNQDDGMEALQSGASAYLQFMDWNEDSLGALYEMVSGHVGGQDPVPEFVRKSARAFLRKKMSNGSLSFSVLGSRGQRVEVNFHEERLLEEHVLSVTVSFLVREGAPSQVVEITCPFSLGDLTANVVQNFVMRVFEQPRWAEERALELVDMAYRRIEQRGVDAVVPLDIARNLKKIEVRLILALLMGGIIQEEGLEEGFMEQYSDNDSDFVGGAVKRTREAEEDEGPRKRTRRESTEEEGSQR